MKKRMIFSHEGFCGFTSEDVDSRKEKILSILSSGKIVAFTNKHNPSIVKHVHEWNADEDGDLTATYSTGRTKSVCWETDDYEISELDKPQTK